MNARTMLFRLSAAVALAAGLTLPGSAQVEPAGAVPAGHAAPVAGDAEVMTWSTGVRYSYDGAGNVHEIGTDTFKYDAVGRLVESKANGIRRNYAYDRYGNRTQCVQGQGTPSQSDCQYGYSIDAAANRIASVTYDGAGNLHKIGTHTYTYDALNALTRDDVGATPREYVYDANGERIAVYEVNAAKWRWTFRDPSGKVLREFTSTGNGTANWKWSKDYIWRDGLLLATRQIEPGKTTAVTYHYHLDHLGTPRRITDDADRIVGIHDYHAFGPEVSGGQNEPALSVMKFTGHERDTTGLDSWDTLDYMHARYYNGTLGRFLSVDPVLGTPSRPQSWNRYSYVENDPIGAIDPTGMKMECVTKDDGTEECTVVPDEPLPDPLPHPDPSPDWVYELQGALNPVLDAAGEKKLHADQYWRWFWNPPEMLTGTVMVPGFGNAAQALLGTSRVNLLQNITNPRLRNLINQLYRPNARVGTGSTADAIRYEAQTGVMLSRAGHFQKGLEMRTALVRVLRQESLTAAERQAVRAVLIDLQKALSGL